MAVIQPEHSWVWELDTLFPWLAWNKRDRVVSGHICQTGDYWGNVNVFEIYSSLQSKVLQDGCQKYEYLHPGQTFSHTDAFSYKQKTKKKKKKRCQWSILLITYFTHNSMKVQTSQNEQAALQYFGEAWIELGTKGLEQWEPSMCEGSLKALVAHVLLFDGLRDKLHGWVSLHTHLVEGIGGSFMFAKKGRQLEL